MKQITVELKSAVTESGKTFYGGQVYLDNKPIKFIPFTDEKKEKMEKYLNFLRTYLVYSKVQHFDFVHYVDKTGKSMEYWSSVPVC